MGAIWKPVDGFEKLYMVSSDGEVRSIRDGKPYTLTPRKARGYSRVILRNKGNDREAFVHRLVAEAFIANPFNKPQVNHINCIKADNRVSNLEWATGRENIIHAMQNNLLKFNQKAIVQVLNGEIVKEYNSTVETELDGYVSASVRSCLIGRRKQYRGFQWKYKSVA